MLFVRIVLNLFPCEQRAPTDERALFEQSGAGLRTKKVLIYFLGGVTYAEIAAVRFLNKRMRGRFQFVIATTSIISSEKCM